MYKLYSTNDTEDNLILELGNNNLYPILYLTDEFINKSMIATEEFTVKALNNTVTSKDIDGTDQLIFLFSINSTNDIENSIYYNKESKTLIALHMVNEIDADQWKNRLLNVKCNTYGNVRHSDITSSSITLPFDNLLKTLPTPNSLIDVVLTKITLDLTGFVTNSAVKSVDKQGIVGVRKGVNTLDVVAIKTVDIGWDSIPPVLHTILSFSPYGKSLLYLGKPLTEYIYIPLT